jgi:hypothetical protein
MSGRDRCAVNPKHRKRMVWLSITHQLSDFVRVLVNRIQPQVRHFRRRARVGIVGEHLRDQLRCRPWQQRLSTLLHEASCSQRAFRQYHIKTAFTTATSDLRKAGTAPSEQRPPRGGRLVMAIALFIVSSKQQLCRYANGPC